MTKSGNVRKPQFAGSFYPADPAKLTAAVKAFMLDAEPAKAENISAIIVPHAGYIYAGQIIADAYNQVKDNKYDVIVVLGTNHTTADFTGVSVYPSGSFGTPIGDVEIDEQLASELLKDKSFGRDLSVHNKEHSIEVQIPFIKYLLPGTKILPVIVGESNTDYYIKFGKALASLLKDKKALIVASSDLSHYPVFDDAVKVDKQTLNTITSLNVEEINHNLHSVVSENKYPGLLTCACGEAPVMAAVAAAKELGADYGSVISYSNSGYNPAGSLDRVVGYGAVAIGRGNAPASSEIVGQAENPDDYQLTREDKKTLLQYARNTLTQYFTSETLPLPRNVTPGLLIKRGAFVTINKNGQLRGCIGQMASDAPLYTFAGTMALQAALSDPRFPHLSKDEVKDIEIEISVLSPFKPVEGAGDIVLGRDGVMIKKDGRQGVFLPQVADETNWDKETFLNQLCYKAGLKAGDWKDAKLFTFQADVFSENEFR